MGFRVVKSEKTPGASVIELAPLGRETKTAELLADEKCFKCLGPIGVEDPFHRVNDRVVHVRCAKAL